METSTDAKEADEKERVTMGRLRIVTERFSANTFNHERVSRQFNQGDALVFLRDEEEGWTFFARVDDIPERQPQPPQQLPEYMIATTTFNNSTRRLPE